MFDIKKDPSKICILASGSGWELAPKESEKVIFALNDYIRIEKYRIKPDALFIMDVLDDKPQIVSGVDNLGDVIQRINNLRVPLIGPYKYEEIPLSEVKPYLQKHLRTLPAILRQKDKGKLAEDALMYSTLFQNYALKYF